MEKTVKDLLINEIKDLYSAEKQLVVALPKMIEGAYYPALKEAFTIHLKETKMQVQRIEKIASKLEMTPGGKKCIGMEGCVKEGIEALKEKENPIILDLGIIAAGSRIENYELAGYKTAISLAEKLGEQEVIDLLNESLVEEKGADDTLLELAAGLIKEAPMA